ncbi:MAG: hypothetical protein JWM19_4648 [Actinomycetia bacterium]|nr:hypothetical protein [Actinomycetes bacterium]
MPTIDVYAAAGTIAAAFIHELPVGALDRDKQLALVRQFTDRTWVLTDRTWVLFTEAPDGGWGLAGHASTNAELIASARAQIAQISATIMARSSRPH